MPFNSQFNSLDDTVDYDVSFHALQNNYNIAADGGYNMMVQPAFQYRPLAGHFDNSYIQAGRTGQQPYFNSDELKRINGNYDPYQNWNNKEKLKGEGIGRFFKNMGRSIRSVAIQSGNAISNSVTDQNGLLHQGISKALDYGVPIATEALGTAVGTAVGNPALGAVVGQQLSGVARDGIKSETGYGLTPKCAGKKGKKAVKIDLVKVLNKYAPDKTTDVIKSVKSVKLGNVHMEGGSVKKSLKNRNDLCKQIMKEKNLSLPQASKYVKDNHLY